MTFRLVEGQGPVHIAAQHIVGMYARSYVSSVLLGTSNVISRSHTMALSLCLSVCLFVCSFVFRRKRI